ncbi:MAG: EamA family transporter [Sphingobacteriaceae bacterium]
MKENRLKYLLAAVSATSLWGFFSITLRKLKAYPSDQILHYRIFTSLAIIWLIILIFRKKELKADVQLMKSYSPEQRKKVIWLTLLAGVLITGNWYSFIYAVNHINLTSAAFAYMVCPLITAMGGFLLLKEHLTPLKLLALGVALLSILILAQGSLRDVLWAIGIAVLYAFYLIIQRIIQGIDKLNMLGVHLIISAIFTLPFFIYHYNGMPTDLNFWVNIVIIAVVYTIIPLFLSLYALIGIPSSTMGIIIYTNPIVAFAVAFFYFHETINHLQVIAYSMLVVAIIVFNWNLLAGLLFKSKKESI